MCDDAFNLHGVSATTNSAAPLFIVNGPVRKRLDINSGAGVLGPGQRANATIGRALRLIVRNLGGAAAGGITMSTLAHPGYFAYCIGENEEESPWTPFSVEQGFAPGESTVTAFAGGGAANRVRPPEPHGGRPADHGRALARGDLAPQVAPTTATPWSSSRPSTRVCSRTSGWDRPRMRTYLWERLRKPVRDLVPGVDGGEGLPAHVLRQVRRSGARARP